MTIDRLDAVIDRHGRWSDLKTYTARIDAHVESDFGHAIENAKALLESICKEICEKRGVDLGKQPSIQALMKKAFTELGYPSSNLITQISTSLSTIGQKMGELRNEISPTSHGKSLEDLKKRNDEIDDLTREFLVDTTVSVACFLIRAYEDISPRRKSQDVLVYSECSEFNELIDGDNKPFEVGTNSYPASEAFFGVDYTSYRTEYMLFLEGDDE